jgi:transposase
LAEGRKEVITKMLAAGMTASDVASIVGCSINAIQDLQNPRTTSPQ